MKSVVGLVANHNLLMIFTSCDTILITVVIVALSLGEIVSVGVATVGKNIQHVGVLAVMKKLLSVNGSKVAKINLK
jgi:hypothetical protein